MSEEFKLPNETERVVVLGRTGSGKTFFMKWLLSHASITERPWIIIDHKRSDGLEKLPRIEEIRLGTLPKYPGLYIVKPRFTEDETVDIYLHRILERGNVGIFTDEGSKIPQREPRFVGLKSIFAQGRSKRVPILFGTQRPAWINKSVLSEGDYYAMFHLQDADDIARAAKVMPRDQIETRLAVYNAHWYDVKRNAAFRIMPVDPDETLERLDRRLKPRVHFA